MTTLLVVAGEASGDLHGGEILKALKDRNPNLRLVGVGGAAMTPFLDRKVADVRDLSVMGLVEVLRHLPRLYRLKQRLLAVAQEEGCTGALLIDYQDFNRALAQGLRRQQPGIRLHQYVCPQVWAWKRGRIPKIGRLFDVLYCLFPFEPPLFAGYPVEALCLGNPLVDRVAPELERTAFFQSLGLAPDKPVVALLPGSRWSELNRLLPVLLETVDRWQATNPQRPLQWVLPVAPSLDMEAVQVRLEGRPIALTRATYAARAHADAALVCSGTATLETALLGTPMVLFYKLHPLTYWLARRLVKVQHFGLVNIVAGKTLVTELCQEAVTATRLCAELEHLLKPEVQASLRAALGAVRTQLGDQGAADRVAAHLAHALSSQ